MKAVHVIAYILLLVGGLNWGLVGLFNYNLVAAIFAGITPVVYILVGLAALYFLITDKRDWKGK